MNKKTNEEIVSYLVKEFISLGDAVTGSFGNPEYRAEMMARQLAVARNIMFVEGLIEVVLDEKDKR